MWRYIVRPIAVGGMMVGTCYTLFRMRKNLIAGLGKAFAELRGRRRRPETVSRTERYMSSKTVFALIGVTFLLMCVLYIYIQDWSAGASWRAGDADRRLLLRDGFGLSGGRDRLVQQSDFGLDAFDSGDRRAADGVAGRSGMSGVVAVLGVAAVVCVSSAVAGELLQDFKVGYILGGTPRNIQIIELIAVVVASW